MPTRSAIDRGIVTTGGQRVINLETLAQFYDFAFGEMLQRSMNLEAGRAFNTGARGEVCHRFKGRDVFRPTIRVTGIIQRIHPDEEIGGAHGFRPGQRERQKDRVSRRHVRDRNFVAWSMYVAVLGDLCIGRQRRSAPLPQVNVNDQVPSDTLCRRDPFGRVDFSGMSLSVTKRHGIRSKSVASGNRERSG